MGVQVNRIEKEYILTNIQNTGVTVSVHGYKKEALFSIASFTDEVLKLKKAEETGLTFAKDEQIRIFFPFQNNYYTFESKVKQQLDDKITIDNPASIYRDPQRKFERIKLKEIEVFFILAGDKIELDFPKTDTFHMVEEPEYSNTFNPASIVDLINTLRSFVQGKVTDHKIIMYREKVPQSFEERLTIKEGKTLWIPSTEEDIPLNDPSFSGNIIVKKEVEDFLEEAGTPKYLVRSEISNMLATKAKSSIVSEIFCPILYHEYAVGYIYTVNKRPKVDKFNKEFLDYIILFSRVLSYSLEINGYYRQHRKKDVHHKAPVIDMSAAGLLFATAEEEINQKISLLNDMELYMVIEGRKIGIGTRIMRKFKDAQNNYFAAQFLKIKDEDFSFLFEYLYGRPYSESAQQRWEGGSPPPQL